ELTRVGLGHSNILPARRHGKPSQMSPICAADPLDFDAEGRLLGVEVLDARGKLPPELLRAAEGITRR
ncbi:DUF2283 domain-containing protein, partial [Actinoplanes sp. NPDC048796]|uniref:DUF2283 domain-containing protein n=1 Tax=Actinoplanes sp. NPDC048796 TaxID=3155640 RepID=UPI0033F85BB8